jgi:hypothetical protein
MSSIARFAVVGHLIIGKNKRKFPIYGGKMTWRDSQNLMSECELELELPFGTLQCKAATEPDRFCPAIVKVKNADHPSSRMTLYITRTQRRNE